ncbi:MAG: hypothetical protein QSU88_07940, partial [Candidatus Methanoperedens sp.]|nr:hypothetical protein [Candidatus Methanoperedens sp.]
MPKKGVSKYANLLEDEDVARWLRNIERGSPITADVAIRRLGRACELLKLSPKQMVEKANKNLKSFQDSLEDLVFQLEKEKKSPQYITGIIKHVRQWLRYNDIIITRKIKVSNSSAT